jgi:hypothetical protein
VNSTDPTDGSRLVYRDLFFVHYSAAAGRQSGLYASHFMLRHPPSICLCARFGSWQTTTTHHAPRITYHVSRIRAIYRDGSAISFNVHLLPPPPPHTQIRAIHRDGSIISFNIQLNPPEEFDGGGTFIEADEKTYNIGRGDCFVHSGKLRHAGTHITRGERLILVGCVDLIDY